MNTHEATLPSCMPAQINTSTSSEGYGVNERGGVAEVIREDGESEWADVEREMDEVGRGGTRESGIED